MFSSSASTLQLSIDETFMHRCLVLARKGAGRVSPNPMVGAVIVLNDQIIGEGWHEAYGKPHAEVNAIAQVEDKFADASAEMLKESTIYVNLEPCAHYGKTPPCADLIIGKGLSRVVVGCRDPFPSVNGKGNEKIVSSGIQLSCGILEKQCREINSRFFTSILKQRPWIILKWAASADGFLAPTPYIPFWISSDVSKILSHKWRSEEDAILVGKNTAILDDPELTVRNFYGKNPIRLVIDWNLELPHTLKLFNNKSQTFVFNGQKSGQEGNIRFIHLEFREYLVPYLLYQLYMLDIRSVIVEGGSNLLNQFIAAGLWDEARVFKSPLLLKKGLAEPIFHFAPDFIETSGSDQLHIFSNPILGNNKP